MSSIWGVPIYDIYYMYMCNIREVYMLHPWMRVVAYGHMASLNDTPDFAQWNCASRQ